MSHAKLVAQDRLASEFLQSTAAVIRVADLRTFCSRSGADQRLGNWRPPGPSRSSCLTGGRTRDHREMAR